jgi:micrococcal nuclease
VAGCSTPAPEHEQATVARTGDGDTLDLRSGGRVRLVQVDAPELGEGECYSREARDELEGLAPPGAAVELERDPDLDDTDRFARRLRYVHAGDVNVNVELVRRGAATPYFLGGDEGRHADALLDAVAEARAEGRGMWGACRVAWEPDRPVVTRSR